MPNGTIKKKIDAKGFGFISVAGEPKDYFFHSGACAGQFDSLREGQAVSFNVEQSARGPKAVDVAAA